MADEIDDINEGQKDLNENIKKGNEALDDTIYAYRRIADSQKTMARNMKDEYSARESINSLQKQLVSSVQRQVDINAMALSGVRSIVEIQRDQVKVQSTINKLRTDAYGFSQKIYDLNQQITRAAINATNEEKEALKYKLRAFKIFQGQYFENAGSQEVILDGLKDEESLVRKINKQLGLAPGILSGIDKTLRSWNRFTEVANALDIKGAIDRTKISMTALNAETGKLPNAFTVAKTLNIELFKSLGGNVTKANLLAFAVFELGKGLLIADKAQAEMQKSLNLSRGTARDMRGEFAGISNSSNSMFVTIKGIQESFLAISSYLGTSSQLSGDILDSYTKLTKQAGISNELSLKFTAFGLTQGKTASELLKTAMGEISVLGHRNKLQLNAKQIVEDIAKISAGAAAAMGNQVEKLAKSAATARILGTTIQIIEQSAASLLDFETSIGNELTAQLMTGKDLNLNKAREYALQGDLAGVGKELIGQAGSLSELQRMNVFQQQSMASALGMTRDQYSEMLLQAEARRKAEIAVGIIGEETAQQAFERMKQTMSLQEIKIKMGDEDLANQMNSVSVQERWNVLVEKMMESFVQIGDFLMPVIDLLAPALEVTAMALGIINSIFKDIGDAINDVLLSLGVDDGLTGIIDALGPAIKFGIVAPFQVVRTLVDGILTALRIVFNTFNSIGNIFKGDFGVFESNGQKWQDFEDRQAKQYGNVIKNTIPDEELRKNAFPNLNEITKSAEEQGITKFAEGGIVNKPTLGLVGEAGPEAVIPLNSQDSEIKNLLKSILAATREGKNISMDGYNISSALQTPLGQTMTAIQ